MIELEHPNADLHIPDRLSEQEALARTTHLGVGAHSVDQVQRAAYAVDLTPLIHGKQMRLADYTQSILSVFSDVVNGLAAELEGK